MRGKLSAAESRYRIKLIQERHYKKKEQQDLDYYVNYFDNNTTYKEVHQAHKNRELHGFFIRNLYRDWQR